MVRLTTRTQYLLKWLGIAILIIAGIFLFFTQLLKYIAPFLTAFIIMISIEGWCPSGKELKLPRGPLLHFIIALRGDSGGIFAFTFIN